MTLGRIIILAGIVLLLAGAVVILLAKIGLPLGHLPGDIDYRRRNFSFYFPLATCLVLSVILSLMVYLFNHFRR